MNITFCGLMIYEEGYLAIPTAIPGQNYKLKNPKGYIYK